MQVGVFYYTSYVINPRSLRQSKAIFVIPFVLFDVTEKILPLVKNQHLLLCTLLIYNAMAMEVLFVLLINEALLSCCVFVYYFSPAGFAYFH